MIKLLKKYEIQSTPFDASKNWKLNNTDNTDLLLFESTGSDDGIPFALEFIDYSDNPPFINRSCSIAVEEQSSDLASLQEGLLVTGSFDVNLDPQNIDGTYKRPIYYQVKTMFYNSYRNPTKIWGIENIDFQLSKTKRHLSDKFNLIDIPRNVFGNKIMPKTIIMYDNTLDNPYIITDDGNGNLFAGTNLFSHQQELGEYKNQFMNGTSSFCDSYWSSIID